MATRKPPELPRRSGAPAGSPDNVDGAASAPADKPRAPHDFDLDGMDLMQLLRLHAEVEARLPATSLKNVSMEKSLVLQLMTARELQKQVLDNDEATPAHKAQVTNSLSGVIDTLSKLQIKLFNSERFKDIEAVLIDVINDHMTPQQAQVFFKLYRERLGAPAEGV